MDSYGEDVWSRFVAIAACQDSVMQDEKMHANAVKPLSSDGNNRTLGCGASPSAESVPYRLLKRVNDELARRPRVTLPEERLP